MVGENLKKKGLILVDVEVPFPFRGVQQYFIISLSKPYIYMNSCVRPCFFFSFYILFRYSLAMGSLYI